MPTVELTARFCETAKAVSGRKTDYFDKSTKGLVVRCSAAGQKIWYAVYGPPFKRQWLRLGPYPEIPLGGRTGACQRARDTRAVVSDGGDPAADRKAVATSQRVADMVENYIKRHASTKRSADQTARRLRKNVSNVIGNIKLTDLHRRDITKCLDLIKDRGADIEANRVFSAMRAIIRWAHGRGDLDVNLMGTMRSPTEESVRDRVLTADEIRAMWAALPDADMRESTRRILRLCLITGQRVGEVCGMELAELDLDNALWTIPPERTKNGREHSVPLSSLAVTIIREQMAAVETLCQRKGRKSPIYVFPAPGGRAAATGGAIPKAVKRLEKATKGDTTTIMGIAPWTPHDLRRTAATHMEEIGVSPFVIGCILNHISITKASVTSRVYARYTYNREKRDVLDLWADHLSGIIEGKSEVIAVRGQAR